MMQNDRSNNKFMTFLKRNGYYMVLGLCAVAIAAAGLVFLSDAGTERAALTEPLSVPAASTLPEEETGAAEATVEQPATQTDAEPEVSQPVTQIVEDTVLPVSGAVVQDYAMDRLVYNATTRDWRVHNGVDLAAAMGQEVRAARAGTVTAVYEDEAYGVTVMVRHEDGWSSCYCGLAEELSVAAGDVVTAGQVLGTVGNTALVETNQEPHLHFEVYRNGEPADPAGFLY